MPGSRLPHWGGAAIRSVGRAILRLLGWRDVGELPDQPKMVVVVAPHSSNWDFIIGIAYVMSRNVRVRYIGKRELFRWPLGGLMRWLGGISVDRSSPQGTVDQVVDEFTRAPALVLGITPEGTRKRGANWKLGFYHIAKKAGVPIVPAFLDWKKREVGVLAPFMPTGNLDTDLAHLRNLYAALTRRDGTPPGAIPAPLEPES